jgi:nucleotide-binding universal stress UspA family protein
MSWAPRNTIVVPVDFSEKSLSAVDVALQLVAQPSGVHVVHVLQELSPVEPGEVWHTVDHETRKNHVLEAMAKRFADAKYGGMQHAVVFGDPGSEIAEFAKEVGAELIVLPSHGRTGIKRLLIGSVAERVVRLAHCPVLVLRD